MKAVTAGILATLAMVAACTSTREHSGNSVSFYPTPGWRSCEGTKGVIIASRTPEPIEVRAHLEGGSSEVVAILDTGERTELSLPRETVYVGARLVNPHLMVPVRRDIRYSCTTN